MMLRYTLIAILMLFALPAWANDRVQVASDELNFDEPFDQAVAKNALRSLLNQALDLIENHIEIRGNLQPDKESGTQQGHFQLKLYPHGKSQSDEHISAELRFRSSHNDQHLSFDLKLPKESSALSSQEHSL